mmetsp:Transcript_22290/g.50998  ORF Transcript_22290/g.50998 Transcript_22290/m.50998 type:complete len:351 (+) Transcript_22290:140-1192(+)
MSAATEPGEPVETVTDLDILRCVSRLDRWDDARFTPVVVLQKCPRNRGEVILMKDTVSGRKVAVKRMPTDWVCRSYEEFFAAYPEETEVPWMDIGTTKWLNEHGCTRTVDFVGAYEAQSFTSFVMGFCGGGDMFAYMENVAVNPDGPSREELLRPLVTEMLEAVADLHTQGIAHRDLSLENVLLAQELTKEAVGPGNVRLIDFGMATCQRFCTGPCGKPSYMAPEMHQGTYDPFKADAFSCGVMIYALIARDYPWMSTRPGACRLFEFIRQQGFLTFLHKRRIPIGKEKRPVIEVISEGLATLLTGLLVFDPDARLSLSRQDVGRTVWDSLWLQPASGAEQVATVDTGQL